jgi:hypothetical protein
LTDFERVLSERSDGAGRRHTHHTVDINALQGDGDVVSMSNG